MMSSSYACLLLGGIILQLVTSQLLPKITFISPKQIGDIGGTAEFQCSVENLESVPLVWTKVGEHPLIISVGEALTIPDNRYSLRHNATSSTYALKINDLRSEDAGRYQCILNIGPGTRISTDVELEIAQAEASTPASAQLTPQITFISPKQIGKVGGTAELQCSAKNAQDVALVWTKPEDNGTIIISFGSALLISDNRYSIRHNQTSWTFSLKIHRLRLEDAGRYQCSLHISRNNSPALDVELEVQRAETNDN